MKTVKQMILVMALGLICFSCKSETAEDKNEIASIAATDKAPKRVKAENAKTQFVKSGNLKYAYRVIGKKSEVPVVMLQRFRGTMDDWDPAFINELGKERTVLVFNNAGVASSNGEVPTTIKGMADHAARFAKALGYNKVDVAGWSMGGFVAQVMAIEYPNLVRKLVLIGTGPGGGPDTPAPTEGVFDVATHSSYAEEDHQYLFFTMNKEDVSSVQASLDRISKSHGGKLETPTTPTVMQRQAQAIDAFWKGQGDYYSKLKTMKHETLILNGDRDKFFNVAGQWVLHREIPNSRLAIYPMAGHGAHHEYPQHSGSTITNFLDL